MSKVESNAQKYAEDTWKSLREFLAAGSAANEEFIKSSIAQAYRVGYIRGFGDATRKETVVVPDNEKPGW